MITRRSKKILAENNKDIVNENDASLTKLINRSKKRKQLFTAPHLSTISDCVDDENTKKLRFTDFAQKNNVSKKKKKSSLSLIHEDERNSVEEQVSQAASLKKKKKSSLSLIHEDGRNSVEEQVSQAASLKKKKRPSLSLIHEDGRNSVEEQVSQAASLKKKKEPSLSLIHEDERNSVEEQVSQAASLKKKRKSLSSNVNEDQQSSVIDSNLTNSKDKSEINSLSDSEAVFNSPTKVSAKKKKSLHHDREANNTTTLGIDHALNNSDIGSYNCVNLFENLNKNSSSQKKKRSSSHSVLNKEASNIPELNDWSVPDELQSFTDDFSVSVSKCSPGKSLSGKKKKSLLSHVKDDEGNNVPANDPTLSQETNCENSDLSDSENVIVCTLKNSSLKKKKKLSLSHQSQEASTSLQTDYALNISEDGSYSCENLFKSPQSNSKLKKKKRSSNYVLNEEKEGSNISEVNDCSGSHEMQSYTNDMSDSVRVLQKSPHKSPPSKKKKKSLLNENQDSSTTKNNLTVSEESNCETNSLIDSPKVADSSIMNSSLKKKKTLSLSKLYQKANTPPKSNCALNISEDGLYSCANLFESPQNKSLSSKKKRSSHKSLLSSASKNDQSLSEERNCDIYGLTDCSPKNSSLKKKKKLLLSPQNQKTRTSPTDHALNLSEDGLFNCVNLFESSPQKSFSHKEAKSLSSPIKENKAVKAINNQTKNVPNDPKIVLDEYSTFDNETSKRKIPKLDESDNKAKNKKSKADILNGELLSNPIEAEDCGKIPKSFKKEDSSSESDEENFVFKSSKKNKIGQENCLTSTKSNKRKLSLSNPSEHFNTSSEKENASFNKTSYKVSQIESKKSTLKPEPTSDSLYTSGYPSIINKLSTTKEDNDKKTNLGTRKVPKLKDSPKIKPSQPSNNQTNAQEGKKKIKRKNKDLSSLEALKANLLKQAMVEINLKKSKKHKVVFDTLAKETHSNEKKNSKELCFQSSDKDEDKSSIILNTDNLSVKKKKVKTENNHSDAFDLLEAKLINKAITESKLKKKQKKKRHNSIDIIQKQLLSDALKRFGCVPDPQPKNSVELSKVEDKKTSSKHKRNTQMGKTSSLPKISSQDILVDNSNKTNNLKKKQKKHHELESKKSLIVSNPSVSSVSEAATTSKKSEMKELQKKLEPKTEGNSKSIKSKKRKQKKDSLDDFASEMLARALERCKHQTHT